MIPAHRIPVQRFLSLRGDKERYRPPSPTDGCVIAGVVGHTVYWGGGVPCLIHTRVNTVYKLYTPPHTAPRQGLSCQLIWSSLMREFYYLGPSITQDPDKDMSL